MTAANGQLFQKSGQPLASKPTRGRAVWVGAIVAMIAYGSLFPFNFTNPVSQTAAWENFLLQRSIWTSRGDILGNIALFMPLGAAWCAFQAPAWTSTRSLRCATILVTGVAIAFLIQSAQLYLPSRSAALADVFWNTVGMLLGMSVGSQARNLNLLRVGDALRQRYDPVPLMVLALWISAELVPFLPSLDFQLVRSNLSTVLAGTFNLAGLALHAGGALVAGRTFSILLGEREGSRWALAALILVGSAKFFIVANPLDASSIAGLMIGYFASRTCGRLRPVRRDICALLLIFTAYALNALLPFDIADHPTLLNLIPFRNLLQGSMLDNSRGLLANLCLYAGFLSIIRANGTSTVPASIVLGMLVALFECAQMYLAGRTPDITDPLLVMLIGQLLQRLPTPSPSSPSPHIRTDDNLGKTSSRVLDRSGVGHRIGRGWPARIIGFATIGAAITLGLRAVLTTPSIPYNLSELFRGNGSVPYIFVFALALLWVGSGAALGASRLVASTRPWLSLPLSSILASLVCLLLLDISVTGESIDDIAGANNIHWFVTERAIWGEWWQQLFLATPPELISFLERQVRFTALYGPLVTIYILVLAAPGMSKGPAARFPQIAASAIAWLWLCKLVAFNWSSTDNLNELIAKDLGGIWLYALLILMCANASIVARTPARLLPIMLSMMWTFLAIPLGWWLLNQGLESRVSKYELVFSGVQFLLGPDRSRLLGAGELFMRWSLLQGSATIVMAAGTRLAADMAKREGKP